MNACADSTHDLGPDPLASCRIGGSAMTERDRLHAHIHRALADRPWLIRDATKAADAIHMDGSGPMQPAIDAALAKALEANA